MTTESNGNHVSARAVSDQLGNVLAECRYLRERFLSAREACLTRNTRKCIGQLMHAMESYQKLGEQIADVVEMFTGKSVEDGDAELHSQLRKMLGTDQTETAAV